jgi:putative SOS response-associated peptidase YedK
MRAPRQNFFVNNLGSLRGNTRRGKLGGMCYSALVKQNLKDLALRFSARIDHDAFEEMFTQRAAGQKIHLSKALEQNFLLEAKTSQEKKIRDLIITFNEQELAREETLLFQQKKRLADAERKLAEKPTKAAQENKRIATNKIEWLKKKIIQRQDSTLTEADARIYAFHYAPLIVADREGKRVIRPFRYHCRPNGKPESFDREYGGCYNARRDSLKKVAFWKNLYGKKHGVAVITRFYENVSEHTYFRRELKPGEEEKNLVISFAAPELEQMLVPCIYDDWESKDKPPLHSFALITDDPPAEILATGHDRCPILMKEENLDKWLRPEKLNAAEIEAVLADKVQPSYQHAAAG